MLELIRVRNAADKSEQFAKFDPARQSWVVSDLQSKWHLQKLLLARHGVLEDTTVLRATELWKNFAFQLRPDLRLLSAELAQTLFWDWIEPKGLPWARSPRAVQVVLRQMQLWMTIFSNPAAPDIMQEWFSENPEAQINWGHWYTLCEELWTRCQERQLAMVSWLPALLLNEDLTRLNWNRGLLFDLGPQVTLVEGVLLRELGAQGEVGVLYPKVPWAALMPNALRPYETITGETQTVEKEWQPEPDSRLHFGRFSTQLAEVKDAVARVRTWLETGVEAQRIAIVAPDIEEYWPALRMYFQQEGIPLCKAESARLGSFSEMARWLANLRTAQNKISSEDLELHFFAHEDRPRLTFDQFKILFSNVYDATDLSRARQLFEGRLTAPANESQTLQDFLVWALSFWDASAESARLLAFLQVTGQEVPRDLSLLPRQWLSYVEGLLARREYSLKAGDESGVWCISLSSANWLEVDHGVILNMNEGSLRQMMTSQVSSSEAHKIFTDTGFAIGSPDRQELEFELLWMLDRPWRELHLSFATTDFAGSVLTPSRLWMWTAIVNGKFRDEPQAPKKVRWDEIQRQSLTRLETIRSWSPARAQSITFGLNRDVDRSLSSWRPTTEVRASASSLERYLECPFMFAAQRQLKLSDDPALDLDLDRRTRGNLLHALVEALMTEPPRWGWSDAELSALVDQTREAQEIQVGDERLWPAVRAQHVHLARLFLRFEQEWRGRFPATVTVGRETAFECYWDAETGLATSTQTGVLLSGRLDRVDRDSAGRYALIDYKASSMGLTNWDRWIGNGSLQMALYSMLLEAGLAGHEAGPVAAANYYIVREGDRRKGFHLKDPVAELYSADDKHRNFIDTDDKVKLFTDLRSEIQRALKAILAGEFNPAPRDIKICERCSWRTLCRAPHLN